MTNTAFFTWSLDLVKLQYNHQLVTQLLLFFSTEDSFLKALLAHVAVDYIHKRFDNEFSEYRNSSIKPP